MAVKKLIEGDKRSIVGEFEFALPPDAIWAAMTDPKEIERWFCFRARVEGSVGGEIEFDWKPFFDFDWIDEIKAWEPNHRLAFGSKPEEVQKAGRAYLCDFVIHSDKGKTNLRMVQSGFTTDTKWDDEFDSFFGGWTYELHSLWHYLTFHRGKNRHTLKAQALISDLEVKKPLERLTDAEGFFEGKTIRDLKEGDRYTVKLSDDDIIQGTVVQSQPYGMDQFAGTIDNMNNGLFRIGAGSRFCFTWISVYGYQDKDVAHLEPLLRAKFEQALVVSA